MQVGGHGECACVCAVVLPIHPSIPPSACLEQIRDVPSLHWGGYLLDKEKAPTWFLYAPVDDYTLT